MKDFKAKHEGVPIFVEGRVGMIERESSDGTKSTKNYISELKAAGAFGAFVAGGLADGESVEESWQTLCDAASI